MSVTHISFNNIQQNDEKIIAEFVLANLDYNPKKILGWKVKIKTVTIY